MGAVGLAIVAIAVITTKPGIADPVATWQPFIAQASQRFGIPKRWIERVIRAESGGHITWRGSPIRSRVGAIGLMQLMPKTWEDMRQTWQLGKDPDDPHDNIMAGTAYLRAMYDQFGYPGLFAGYNAGPARYALSLATGRRLPAETIAYLASVTELVSRITVLRRAAAVQTLFVVRHDASPERADGIPSPATADAAPTIFSVRADTP